MSAVTLRHVPVNMNKKPQSYKCTKYLCKLFDSEVLLHEDEKKECAECDGQLEHVRNLSYAPISVYICPMCSKIMYLDARNWAMKDDIGWGQIQTGVDKEMFYICKECCNRLTAVYPILDTQAKFFQREPLLQMERPSKNAPATDRIASAELGVGEEWY